MLFSFTTIKRVILFSVIFVVVFSGIFGITTIEKTYAQFTTGPLPVSADRYCKEKYTPSTGVVSKSACDAAEKNVFACENIPTNADNGATITGGEGNVCRIAADGDGKAADAPPTPAPTTIQKFAAGAVNSILNAIASLILTLASLILTIAGKLFDLSIVYTIIEGSGTIKGIKAIGFGWSAIRDVANILFIFIILYIAIQTILRASSFNTKQLLTRVVIAALLINFSLFFTKVIIDASNITTVAFYDQLIKIADNSGGATPVAGDSGVSVVSEGISGAFMNTMNLGTIYAVTGIDEFKTVVFQIMGSIFVLIAAFVFFTVAILLIVRFILFIILMVTSPIGFIGGLLPQLDGLSKKWWGTLWNQALFAPAFMLLAFISFGIIAEINKINSGGRSLVAVFEGGSVEVVISFVIAIGFLITSLLVAKNLASSGAGKLVSTATKLGGTIALGGAALAGRRVTQLGAAVANKSGITSSLKRAEETSGLARLALRGGRALGTSSFDARNVGVVKKNLAGVDFGAGGKGGFIDRQKEDEKKEDKKTKERAETYGVATEQTKNRLEEAQNVLEERKRAYAQAETPEEKREAQEGINTAEKAFGAVKAEHESEVQDSRTRTVRHELDNSGVSTVMSYLRTGGAGAGAVKGRKEALEKAESAAAQERDKEQLNSISGKLEIMNELLSEIETSGDLSPLTDRIIDLQRNLSNIDGEIAGIDPNNPNSNADRLLLEKQRSDVEQTLSTLRQIGYNRDGLEKERDFLNSAHQRGQKKKEKEDLADFFKKGVKENKDKDGDSEKTPPPPPTPPPTGP